MRLSSIVPYALCISSVAALLADCSGNLATGVPTTSGSALRTHLTSSGTTFLYIGKPQLFRVPPNVHSVTVVMRGASGEYCHNHGGRGARVFAVIPVTPHQKLFVYVGGQGNGTSGGFNGGGNGGDPPSFGNPSSGGGGASDVRVAPGRRSDRILVASGGGGDGEPFGNKRPTLAAPVMEADSSGAPALGELAITVPAAAAPAVRRALVVSADAAAHRVLRSTVMPGKTASSASVGPAGEPRAAIATVAAAGAAVLRLLSPKPRKFVFGRIGKTPPATVL